MADRYRRPVHPGGVTCPSCGDAFIVWRPRAQPTVDGRFGVWVCASTGNCGHKQDLVHWLTPGVSRWTYIQPEAFGDNPEYVERYDVMTGKKWWARKGRVPRARRASTRARVYQVTFTDAQYQLIRWALWKHDNGWSHLQIYEVIKHFWHQQFGQTPLNSNTIPTWGSTRLKMKQKGLEWP